MQLAFVNTITEMRKTRRVYWMDETTFNLWMQPTTTWTGIREPVAIPKPTNRGSSLTVIGCIDTDRLDKYFEVHDRTNILSVESFMDGFIKHCREKFRHVQQVVICLDNHVVSNRG